MVYDLSDLSVAEQDMLIRLPYRVGVWVSESDEGGGDDADALEKQALNVLITAYVEDFCKSEFVQRVMEQTVAQKDRWSQWEDDISSVPEECKHVMGVLSDRLPYKELNAFKDNLYEIGYSVAMAYREFDDEASGVVKLTTYVKLWIERVLASLKGDVAQSEDEALNISNSERIALNTLYDALTQNMSTKTNASLGTNEPLAQSDEIPLENTTQNSV